jgi:hypothetical protein
MRRSHDVPPGQGHVLDVQFTTVDSQGRLSLQTSAVQLGWQHAAPVGLVVDDGILRIADTRGAFREAEGVAVGLDRRGRLQLPCDLRSATGLAPGVRAITLPTIDRGLIVLPLSRLAHGEGVG